MGHGTYDSTVRATRASFRGYDRKSKEEIFQERSLNNAMSPYGVGVRESRDSAEHPNSLPIIIGLDVTGSMGSIPHHLVKEGLPDIMDRIIKGGVPDPQVLFVGLGDHTCDSAPLQVGQFESSDELLDKWLTTVYLEGGGGGNDGESYSLAWYFGAKHTALDSLEKRNKKGILITIGDEPVLKHIPKAAITHIMGAEQAASYTEHELLALAQEKYEVYHINIAQTGSGRRPLVADGWRQVIRDNLVIAEHYQDVGGIIAGIVLKHDGVSAQSVQGEAPQVGTAEEEVL